MQIWHELQLMQQAVYGCTCCVTAAYLERCTLYLNSRLLALQLQAGEGEHLDAALT